MFLKKMSNSLLCLFKYSAADIQELNEFMSSLEHAQTKADINFENTF